MDSVTVVTDGTGQVQTRTEYLPYGETWYQEGDETNGPKYNSQELDEETGYYYYNARHYDPETGRFVTADNVVDGQYSTQGWNRYMYCHGNPVRYKDPTGHYVWGGGGSFSNIWQQVKSYFSSDKSTADNGGVSQNSAAEATTSNSGQQPVASTTGSVDNSRMTVRDLETRVSHSLGREVSFSRGLHIVMIEDCLNNDTSITPQQRRRDSYLEPLGNDKFKARYYIINNGHITQGYGTSRSSLHSSNAGNDLNPGQYYIHGEMNSREQNRVYMRLFASKEQADQYYNSNPEGSGWKNQSADHNATRVPLGQSALQLHSPYTEGTDFSRFPANSNNGNPWNGGRGCQLLRGFSEFRQNYSPSEWRNLEGSYYFIH